MIIRCVWEHNGNDTLLYAIDYPGAYTRGKNKEEAVLKMQKEICSFLNWCDTPISESISVVIEQEKASKLEISDADSDVIFDTERTPLTMEEYLELKSLALKSAICFQKLFDSIPDKDKTDLQTRNTFYGEIPRTAKEMYEHTKNVNSYYFGEIGLNTDNNGSIYECRKRGFDRLERNSDFLNLPIFDGNYGEEWSLNKVLRRFVWHDRIHAKAMYRMAIRIFGKDSVPNVFHFEL